MKEKNKSRKREKVKMKYKPGSCSSLRSRPGGNIEIFEGEESPEFYKMKLKTKKYPIQRKNISNFSWLCNGEMFFFQELEGGAKVFISRESIESIRLDPIGLEDLLKEKLEELNRKDPPSPLKCGFCWGEAPGAERLISTKGKELCFCSPECKEKYHVQFPHLLPKTYPEGFGKRDYHRFMKCALPKCQETVDREGFPLIGMVVGEDNFIFCSEECCTRFKDPECLKIFGYEEKDLHNCKFCGDSLPTYTSKEGLYCCRENFLSKVPGTSKFHQVKEEGEKDGK